MLYLTPLDAMAPARSGPAFSLCFLRDSRPKAAADERLLDHSLEGLPVGGGDNSQLMGADERIGETSGGLRLFNDPGVHPLQPLRVFGHPTGDLDASDGC